VDQGACHHRFVSSPLIDEGWAALRSGDAPTARMAFVRALGEGQSGGEVLEGMGQALYLERDYVAAIDHYQLAFAAYRG
jgi:Tfp pilus assembly protein PilF